MIRSIGLVTGGLMRRRDFVFSLAAAVAALPQTAPSAPVKRKGRLKQAVLAHEYSRAPGHDPIAALSRAIEICDV